MAERAFAVGCLNGCCARWSTRVLPFLCSCQWSMPRSCMVPNCPILRDVGWCLWSWCLVRSPSVQEVQGRHGHLAAGRGAAPCPSAPHPACVCAPSPFRLSPVDVPVVYVRFFLHPFHFLLCTLFLIHRVWPWPQPGGKGEQAPPWRGRDVLIPRLTLTPSDSTVLGFTLKRTQFPVRVAYAMTINKAQGLALQKVGVHLSAKVFTHGQL